MIPKGIFSKIKRRTSGPDSSSSDTSRRNSLSTKFAGLERYVSENVHEDFFVDTHEFSTLSHVIKALNSRQKKNEGGKETELDNDKNNTNERKDSLDTGESIDPTEEMPYLKELIEQRNIAQKALEEFVDVNYGYLNGNVVQLGKILRKYEGTTQTVQRLKSKISSCKNSLIGEFEANKTKVKNLYDSKMEYTCILKYLDDLDTLQESPRLIEGFIHGKRYLKALERLIHAQEIIYELNYTARDKKDKITNKIGGISEITDQLESLQKEIMPAIIRDLVHVVYNQVKESNPPEVSRQGLDQNSNHRKDYEATYTNSKTSQNQINVELFSAIAQFDQEKLEKEIKSTESSTSMQANSTIKPIFTFLGKKNSKEEYNTIAASNKNLFVNLLMEATAKCKDLQLVDRITILEEILVQKSYIHTYDILKAHMTTLRSFMGIPGYLVDDFLEHYDKKISKAIQFENQTVRLNGIQITINYPYEQVMYSFYKTRKENQRFNTTQLIGESLRFLHHHFFIILKNHKDFFDMMNDAAKANNESVNETGNALQLDSQNVSKNTSSRSQLEKFQSLLNKSIFKIWLQIQGALEEFMHSHIFVANNTYTNFKLLDMYNAHKRAEFERMNASKEKGIKTDAHSMDGELTLENLVVNSHDSNEVLALNPADILQLIKADHTAGDPSNNTYDAGVPPENKQENQSIKNQDVIKSKLLRFERGSVTSMEKESTLSMNDPVTLKKTEKNEFNLRTNHVIGNEARNKHTSNKFENASMLDNLNIDQICAADFFNIIILYKPTITFLRFVEELMGWTELRKFYEEVKKEGSQIKRDPRFFDQDMDDTEFQLQKENYESKFALSQELMPLQHYIDTFVDLQFLPIVSSLTNSKLRKVLGDTDGLLPRSFSTENTDISNSHMQYLYNPERIGENFQINNTHGTRRSRNDFFPVGEFSANSRQQYYGASFTGPNEITSGILKLCKPLIHYRVILPEHQESISNIVSIAFESYIHKVKEELKSLLGGKLSSEILESPTGENFKISLYQSKVFIKLREPLVICKTVEKKKDQKRKQEQADSSENSFVQVHRDIWELNSSPYVIQKNKLLLDKKKFVLATSLAYGLEWLMENVDDYVVRSLTSQSILEVEDHTRNEWILGVLKHLMDLSTKGLLSLRLDLMYTCFYYFQKLSCICLDRQKLVEKSEKVNFESNNLSKARETTIEGWIANLTHYLLSIKEQVESVARVEYLQIIFEPLQDLFPDLWRQTVVTVSRFLDAETIGSLFRVLVSLEQALPLLFEGIYSADAEDDLKNIPGNKEKIFFRANEGFDKARLFLSLYELTNEEEIFTYAHKNLDTFSRNEYLAIWLYIFTKNHPESKKTDAIELRKKFSQSWSQSVGPR